MIVEDINERTEYNTNSSLKKDRKSSKVKAQKRMLN